MNELELIARLTRSLPGNDSLVIGAGDDCAVLDLGIPDRLLLFKTDATVEGVHFEPPTAPHRIGHKALARCLSDVAAMGGTPTTALITLGLPQKFEADFLENVYSGINALAQRHQVAIAGGETTSNPERLLISIALLGTVPKDKCLRRAGAQPGDAIFVTGQLGGSISGHHLDFEPRLAEGRWLAAHFPVHAMIDLSDGLASDLRHLLVAGQAGAELLRSAVPISRAAKVRARAGAGAKPALAAALTDGEDFELLFTLPSPQAVPLLDSWKIAFPDLPLACIGKITAEPGVRLRDATGVRSLTQNGYIHFA